MNRAEILESLRKYILPERAQRIHQAAIERTRLIKVVIEDIYQDNNAGAVFRTCDCFGIQEATVIENRYLTKVAQSISKGSEKWLNTNKFDQQNTNNTVACINDLKSNGYLVVATTPHNPDVLLPDFEVTQKTAIIFGTEGKGLTQDALDLADIKLKVVFKEGAIEGLKRVSTPGLRRYSSYQDTPRVMSGLGTSILSTSKGIVSTREAKKMKIGGEVICNVW